MTSESFFEEIPKALFPYCNYEMNDSRILVYSGHFSLNNRGINEILEGEIYYSLNGEVELVFKGKGERLDLSWFESDGDLQISTPSGLAGKCRLNSCVSCNDGKNTFQGFIQHLFAEQRKCSQWHWSYMNMTAFIGELVTRITENHRSVKKDRLSFSCKDGTKIILENIEKRTSSSEISRYSISHHCALIPANDKSIDFDYACKYIIAFSHFIGFAVGRYHSPILIEGIDDKDQHFSYHFSGYDKSRVGVNSWLPYPNDTDIESLWPIFEEIWNGDDADKADILSTALHWYQEANINSGKAEGAFIMAITGIQMMSNVILTEEELKGKNHLQNLLKRMKYKPTFDPKSLIDTRNQLIHYNKDNRTKYNTLTREQKLMCLENALSVLELSILYWLEYHGRYADRTDANKWRGASTKKVPWADVQDEKIILRCQSISYTKEMDESSVLLKEK